MKTTLILMAAAALLCATAFAQDDKHHEHGGAPPAHHADHGTPRPTAGHAPGSMGHAPAGPPPGRMHEEHMRGGPAMSGPQKNMMRERGTMRGQSNNSAPSGAMRAQGGGHAHGQIDLHSYQRNFAAPRRFHIGGYHAPQGYHYRRWSYGERLPSIFFVRDYWITDFALYGLMPPPYGYVWVRYGPDALLIDEYSGEVIQVEYGLFY